MRSGDAHLAFLVDLVSARLGLNLGRGGLNKALEAYAQRSAQAGQTVEHLKEAQDGSPEFQRLVDAVTIQHSWLFRDPEQLEAACAALGGSAAQAAVPRVWVPACASGEDAYSIMALCDAKGLTLQLLGTDINARAIERARLAVYGPWATRSVPAGLDKVLEAHGENRRVVGHIRHQTRYAIHNLLGPAPHSGAPGGKWDLIVCRNVLIYFSQDHVEGALRRLASALAPRGTLVLGASDILARVPAGLLPFEQGGRVLFRKASESFASVRPSPARERNAVAVRPRGSIRAAPAAAEQGSAARKDATPSWRPAPVRSSAPIAPLSGPPAAPAKGRSPSEPAAAGEPAVAVEQAVAQLLDGIACHLGGDLVGAVDKLRAALYLVPELWPAAYYLGLTYDALGKSAQARREYAHASRLIAEGRPLPEIEGHDFAFLQRDVAEIARRRAGAE